MFLKWRPASIYLGCAFASVLTICPAVGSAGSEGQREGEIKGFEKRLTEMVDTAMNAEEVGEVVRLQDGSADLPRTSEGLEMEAKEKVDAWGSPFCIISTGERVVVFSGGPSHLSCNSLSYTSEQVSKASRGLHFGRSDVVVFIVVRRHAVE
jgi:hypothetical protein